ncbi:MAG: PAAR domain-containing protein [Marinifilum sp.]|jgi:uncharacterized Zn-binding protein involved in type VI secretion|nr:PAAR domain-containing protein [Marinifilum sp.]
MAGKPIATLGSNHACPMVTGTTPHVGGPIIGPGASNVLVNGRPVALMGDTCMCTGTPDTIIEGEPTVLINGVPVATVGCKTAHGGVVIEGDATVIIGSKSPSKAFVPLKEIPIPEIKKREVIANRLKDTFTGSKNLDSLHQAHHNQKQNIEEAKSKNGAPCLYNLHWKKDTAIINKTLVTKKVILSASVLNVDEGEEITFDIEKQDLNNVIVSTNEVDTITLKGTVQDNKVELEWEVEEHHSKNTTKE